MFLTVVICTWNRAKLLDQTLAEMRNLVVPSDVDWELLVVNNNCTDHTDEVIQRHGTELPIRRLFESSAGKCHAANRAVAAARGELLIWTDDDVLVNPDWLSEYAKAAAAFPKAGFFGGPIDPWFEGRPPQWLERSLQHLEGVFAVRQLGDLPIEITHPSNLPYGANLAIRASIQKRELYDPRLGPRPKSEIRGEETDLLGRLLNAGVSGRWCPKAGVRHFIPKSRQQVRYLRKFFFGLGQTDAITEDQQNSATLFGRPRWIWRQAVEAEIRYQVARVSASSDVWIRHLKVASSSWGRLWRVAEQAGKRCSQ